MAKTTTRRSVFDFSPELLLAAITSAAFQTEQRTIDEAVVKADYVELSRSPEKLVFELRSTEYERGITGLDRSKTIQSVTHVEWDLVARKSAWTYTSPIGDRFTIKGSNRIEAEGAKGVLVNENYADVRIPLLGGKIEKSILDGMSKGSEQFDALLRKHAKLQG